MVMTRRWYSSAPVVDGRSLVHESGFWAAHLADLGRDFSAEDFGADAADAGAVLERLQDPAAWPVFTLPLRGGHAIVVHYNSGEVVTSTDYFLTHPQWSESLVLASNDQDRIGPGLCWPELAALLDAPDDATGITDPDERLLLLLPVLGDIRIASDAVDRTMDALIAQGAPEECEPLARRLLEGHPMWGAARWSFDADERSWLCDGAHSPRRAPLGEHLPLGRRTALESCLMLDGRAGFPAGPAPQAP